MTKRRINQFNKLFNLVGFVHLLAKKQWDKMCILSTPQTPRCKKIIYRQTGQKKIKLVEMAENFKNILPILPKNGINQFVCRFKVGSIPKNNITSSYLILPVNHLTSFNIILPVLKYYISMYYKHLGKMVTLNPFFKHSP